MLFSELVDYETGDKNCKEFDIGAGANEGNLATVNNEDKNADLALLLEMAYPAADLAAAGAGKWDSEEWVWAGLRKIAHNDVAKPGPYLTGDWAWANGESPSDYAKWMKNQPDQRTLKRGEEGCNEDRCYQNQMRINHNSKWDDTFKFRVHPYACDYQGKYILSASPTSWVDAKVACEDAGLHLAKVRRGAEVDEMKKAMEYFLGPPDPTWKNFDARNWIWLGGNDLETEGTWTWIDGSVIDMGHIKWFPKAGNDNALKSGKKGKGRGKVVMETGQDALAMSRDGLFDDSHTEGRYRSFACQCPGT